MQALQINYSPLVYVVYVMFIWIYMEKDGGNNKRRGQITDLLADRVSGRIRRVPAVISFSERHALN